MPCYSMSYQIIDLMACVSCIIGGIFNPVITDTNDLRVDKRLCVHMMRTTIRLPIKVAVIYLSGLRSSLIINSRHMYMSSNKRLCKAHTVHF